MEEKIMSINELMDRIHEAQALAFQQHIQANAIIINENFVRVPEKMIGNSICPPMICGLEMHYTKAELPDNIMFAVCEVRETEREKEIRQAKQGAIKDVNKKLKAQLCNLMERCRDEKELSSLNVCYRIADEIFMGYEND